MAKSKLGWHPVHEQVELHPGVIHDRFQLVWGDLTPRDKMWVDLLTDGCYTVHVGKKYLYPDEARAMRDAFTVAMNLSAQKAKTAERGWFARVDRGEETEGYQVDLLRPAAFKVMDNARYRLKFDKQWGGNGLEIFYKRKWWGVCRTDLKDNVATGWVTSKTLDQWLKHYRAKVRYGVRLLDHGDGRRSFAVIDSYSDG